MLPRWLLAHLSRTLRLSAVWCVYVTGERRQTAAAATAAAAGGGRRAISERVLSMKA